MARIGPLLAVALGLSAAIRAQDAGRASSAAEPGHSSSKAIVTFADVRPLWDTLRPHAPSALAAMPAGGLEAAWDAWARTHDTEIRARVARGDEDSLANLWLFGTSFTDLPPARTRDIALNGGRVSLSDVADRRLDDLLAALASPAGNERLEWAGEFLLSRRIDPEHPASRERARELLATIWRRMLAENAEYARVLEAPNPGTDPLAWMARYADLYRDRGLSSDTSILSSFAVDRTLEVLSSSGKIDRPIRRVAVVGPGLDFINKADGHDFYPEQTIQPFALIDSLIRLGLSRAGDLSVTTFDVSARVNRHLERARERARMGSGYLMHLVLSETERWSPELHSYWERAGSRIGQAARASSAPHSAATVKVRALLVRPDIVSSIEPLDLNVVLERLEPLPHDERFDLVVATNVFIYYDRFQQTLAMMNVGRMLRPGGSLLSNQAVHPVPPMKPAVGHDTVVYSDRQFDQFFWYQRG